MRSHLTKRVNFPIFWFTVVVLTCHASILKAFTISNAHQQVSSSGNPDLTRDIESSDGGLRDTLKADKPVPNWFGLEGGSAVPESPILEPMREEWRKDVGDSESVIDPEIDGLFEKSNTDDVLLGDAGPVVRSPFGEIIDTASDILESELLVEGTPERKHILHPLNADSLKNVKGDQDEVIKTRNATPPRRYPFDFRTEVVPDRELSKDGKPYTSMIEEQHQLPADKDDLSPSRNGQDEQPYVDALKRLQYESRRKRPSVVREYLPQSTDSESNSLNDSVDIADGDSDNSVLRDMEDQTTLSADDTTVAPTTDVLYIVTTDYTNTPTTTEESATATESFNETTDEITTATESSDETTTSSLPATPAPTSDTSEEESEKTTCTPTFYNYLPSHTACRVIDVLPNIRGVNKKTADVIVDLHNRYRGMENATNMLQMSWDPELAMLAQRLADTCLYQHDKTYQRFIPGRFAVGQNLAFGWDNWEHCLAAWYDEVDDFQFSKGSINGKEIGHYTQMVWADTTRVGCGFAQCAFGPYYICNYGPSGNIFSKNKPYHYGIKGAECLKTDKNGLCDCGDLECRNGGYLDRSTCSCRCVDAPWIKGKKCAMDCSRSRMEYHFCKTEESSSCLKYANWGYQYCPQTCRLCPAGKVTNCKKSQIGKDYDGKTAITRDGYHCRSWEYIAQWSQWLTTADFPDKDLKAASNYCRNPDGDARGPWCYTSDPKVTWQHCDIPLCDL